MVAGKRGSLRKRCGTVKSGRTNMALMGERNDTILDRNLVFHALFDGKNVKPQKMFSSIRYYTPSGMPRKIPHIAENVEKYNEAVRK